MKIKPITFRTACAFIEQYHRHHKPTVGCKFSIGLFDGDRLVGCAVCGRPVSRHLDDGLTCEMVELPKRYRAKDKDSDRYFEGYYFEYPETTYCFESDPTPKMIPCLATYRITDWGLPNVPVMVTIDPETLEVLE